MSKDESERGKMYAAAIWETLSMTACWYAISVDVEILGGDLGGDVAAMIERDGLTGMRGAGVRETGKEEEYSG